MNSVFELSPELVGKLFHLIFFVVTLIFIIYSVILSFHWFAYATNKRISMLALAVYLLGSAFCFIVMAGTLSLM